MEALLEGVVMKRQFVVLLSLVIIASSLFGCSVANESISSQENTKSEISNILQKEEETEKKKSEDSEESSKADSLNNQTATDREYTQEELKEMRLSALSKSYPPLEVDVLEKETYTNLFFRGVKSDDEIFQRLSLFLLDARIGSEVADINYSTNAAFGSISELDNTVLFYCALANAKYFSWEDNRSDGVIDYYLDNYKCFVPYVKDYSGYFKEDIEEQARFFFGEEAVVNHQEVDSIYTYHDYAGVYTPPHIGLGLVSTPYILRYEKRENCYDVVFTSMEHTWGGESFQNPGSGDKKKQEMSVDEAIEWYTEHGAQARVILEEQEDGRLIVKSLEILRGYDTLEEIEERKAYGK